MMGDTINLAAKFDSPLSLDITSVLDKWCKYGTRDLIAVDFFDPMVESYNIWKNWQTHKDTFEISASCASAMINESWGFFVI